MRAHNRFLEGSFASVTEEITAFDLPVLRNLAVGALQQAGRHDTTEATDGPAATSTGRSPSSD